MHQAQQHSQRVERVLRQLYSTWLVLVPGIGALRWLRRAGGVIQAAFMINIALSGNMSLLNHLTIIPALACLDDVCWPKWMRADPSPARANRDAARSAIDLAVLGTIGYLSWPVVANLLQLGGRRQVMNSSFGSFRLVNTCESAQFKCRRPVAWMPRPA